MGSYYNICHLIESKGGIVPRNAADITQDDWDIIWKTIFDTAENMVVEAENGLFRPPFENEEELLQFIERYPRDPNNPHRLTRFTPAQRAERRKTVECFRRVAVDFSLGLQKNSAVYGEMGRPWNLLIANERTEASSLNPEVANLFGNKGNPKTEYRDAKIAELTAKNIARDEAERQVDKELGERRVAIVMDKLYQSQQILNRLDEMTDLSLDQDELAANFFNILVASTYYYEAENFAGKEYNLPFTQEQRDWIAAERQKIDRFQAAVGKISSMANPLYEYLDINEVENNFDMSALNDAYDEKTDNDEEYKQRKFPQNTKDIFISFLGDIFDINVVRTLDTDDNSLAITNALGFDVNEKWILEETTRGLTVTDRGIRDKLVNGNYIAVDQGERTIILCPPKPGTADIRIDIHPEDFYNAFVEGKMRHLMERRAEVDPGYVISSPYFREMRSSFERLVRMGRLPAPDPEEDVIKRYRQQLLEVEAKCKAYLAYKKGGQTDFERERVKFVNELLDFVTMKLTQLDIVKRAQATVASYIGNGAINHDGTVNFDNLPNDIAMDRQNYIGRWRSEKPAEWTKKRIDSYEHKPNHILELNNTMNEANNTAATAQPGSLDYERAVIRLIGAMTLREILKVEGNPAVVRGIETLITNKADPAVQGAAKTARTDIVEALGEMAYRNIFNYVDKDVNSLKVALTTFDPEELGSKVKDTFYSRYGMVTVINLNSDFMKQIADLPKDTPEKYKNAFRDFTQTEILDKAVELYRDGSATKIRDVEGARLLVANTVLHGMVTLNRLSENANGPCTLEMMLTEPEKLQSLQEGIMNSDEFKKLCSDYGIVGNTFEAKNLTKLYMTKNPALTAKALWENAFADTMEKEKEARKLEAAKQAEAEKLAAQQAAQQPVNGAPVNGNPQPANNGAPANDNQPPVVKNPKQDPPVVQNNGPVIH